MLQRSLRQHPRTAALPQLLASRPPCRACKCRCGALVSLVAPTPNPAALQSRGYAMMRRPAPSTFKKRNLQDDDARLGKDRSAQELAAELEWRRSMVPAVTLRILPRHNPDNVMKFAEQVSALLDESGAATADPVRFKALMDTYNFSMAECEYIRQIIFDMVRFSRKSVANAKKLRLTLSRMGSIDSTLDVMTGALRESKQQRAVLSSPEIMYAKAHLTQLATQGSVYQAMVLEGKFALARGDETRAIALWTDAMEQAVETADARSAKGDFTPDPRELSSPWIELTLLLNKRREYAKAERVMRIGCEQDDPISHYHAAKWHREIDETGGHRPTADWLYYMTKSATSGYQKAIHELAVFYAESGWKYLEDEPPDHMKPTPFDSYPHNWVESTRTKLKTKLLEFLRLRKPEAPNPRNNLFLTAIFPSTAKDRYKLALYWLELNHRYHYAPSYLYYTRLLMQKTLWGLADAPKSALELSKQRYKYASEADYKADRPIPKSKVPDPVDPPNPFYDLAKAKTSLREVFYAYEAHNRIARLKQQYDLWRKQGFWDNNIEDEDDLLAEKHLREWPECERKWLRNPEVREMYEHEMEDLYAQAKAICDEQGWDMTDDEGGLLHRAVVKKAVGGAGEKKGTQTGR